MTRAELLAVAKPILLNSEMVQACLEERKSVTRRVVKLRGNPAWSGYQPSGLVLYGGNNIPAAKSPYHPGDILYVRETWAEKPAEIGGGYIYKADIKQSNIYKWSPSRYMPKEAARLFLRVKSVRVERLQEITIDGIEQEGVALTFPLKKLIESEHLKRFSALWNSTIKPAKLPFYGWDANPWVWVIEFERVVADETNIGVFEL